MIPKEKPHRVRYLLQTSPVYVSVFLMRFSFAFTVVALQYLVSSTLELGVISSAYPIMEMLTAMVFGLMSDRFGRKWIIVGALLASSAITFSFTLTVYFPALILIHALQGICAAAIVTGTLASLTDVAKASRRGREMGFYDFCIVFGCELLDMLEHCDLLLRIGRSMLFSNDLLFCGHLRFQLSTIFVFAVLPIVFFTRSV